VEICVNCGENCWRWIGKILKQTSEENSILRIIFEEDFGNIWMKIQENREYFKKKVMKVA
jgi:hypothetical protein